MMVDSLTPEVVQQIAKALTANCRIKAIRIYRDATGRSLMAAKEFFDSRAEFNETDMERKLLRDGLIEFGYEFQNEWEKITKRYTELLARNRKIRELLEGELKKWGGRLAPPVLSCTS